MNNKLELSQLQYLDALLKQIAYYSESKKDLKMVIMVADNLIAGDFMLYNSNKRPQIKDSQYDGVTQYDIPKISDKAITSLLAPFREYNTGVGKTTCRKAVENLDYFMEVIFKDETLINLINDYPWSGLNNLQPYLYNPTFIDKPVSNNLLFYFLSQANPYEVISIISLDE